MKKIAIIGAGKVGTAIGHALANAGFAIGFSSRRLSSVDEALAFLPAGVKLTSLAEAATFGDVILITTPDSEISGIAESLGDNLQGKYVFHLSGASSIEALAVARSSGAGVGCIHPIQTFATIERAIALLPGSYFGVTADPSTRPEAEIIVEALNGKIVDVRDEDKPLYHAAASAASNFLVALIHYASRLLEAAKIPPPLASDCLFPLIEGSLANAKELGLTAALTGPIARGDVETIEKHLARIASRMPEGLPLYSSLAKETLLVAAEKGTLDERRASEIETALATIS